MNDAIERHARSLRRASSQLLSAGQDVVLIGVAGVLLVAGLVVLIDAVQGLLDALAARNMAEAIFSIVENALLALILAELVHTLLVTLGGGSLTLDPFLVIAIVAILRKMLLTTVLAPRASEAEGLITPVIAELVALGVLILILGAALAIVRARRAQN